MPQVFKVEVMNIGELFREYWNTRGRYNKQISNPNRLASSLRYKMENFTQLEEIDQYVSSLSTRKESTRLIMLDFFEYLKKQKNIEYKSCLADKRFYDYPF